MLTNLFHCRYIILTLFSIYFSCVWNGQRCNLNEDFVKVFTEIGVCYTFNGGGEARVTTEPGVSAGLGLVLNVEQYEYMRGSQKAAGVKVNQQYSLIELNCHLTEIASQIYSTFLMNNFCFVESDCFKLP